MLRADGLTKRYGAFSALSDISFTVGKGEIIGLLGRNGAGKSTLMNLLTGYLCPTSGTVKLDDVDIQHDPQWVKRRIGYLPEIPPLYGDMTVDESLRFAAEIKRVPRARRRPEIDRVLEAARVTDHRARLVKHLSKGYRQRVGLAQAMLGHPAVLVLDEPSAGLDPTQIAQMRQTIAEYAHEGAVIVSSHILGEVADLCNRVLVIDHGRAVRQDTMARFLSGRDGALDVRFRESADTRAALAALAGVDRVERLPGREPGCTEARVYPLEGGDLREAVFRLFCERGEALLTLKPHEAALEDVFLSLVEEGGERP